MGVDIMMNGRGIPSLEGFLMTEGIQFGAGLFETVRISDRRPSQWGGHVDRLISSAKALGLDRGLSPELLESRTEAFLKQIPEGLHGMKVIWIPGENEGYLIHQLRHNPYDLRDPLRGLRVGIGKTRRYTGNVLLRHKTLNYLENLLERRHLDDRMLQEHLLLNERDHVAEGTVSNVFICRSGVFTTPGIDEGILPGTMRALVIQWLRENDYPITEGPVTPEMLRKADQIYLTNALMGLMPVSSFEGNWYDVDRVLCQGFYKDTFQDG